MITALAFVCALSADSFATAFAYGSRKIFIPLRSAVWMSLVGCAVLAFSVFCGALAGPSDTIDIVASALLLALGTYKCVAEPLISRLRRSPERPTADADRSRVLSVPESVSLALVLSVDGLAGFAGISAPPLLPVAAAFFINVAALALGSRLGFRVAQKADLDVSFFSGALLVAIALLG